MDIFFGRRSACKAEWGLSTAVRQRLLQHSNAAVSPVITHTVPRFWYTDDRCPALPVHQHCCRDLMSVPASLIGTTLGAYQVQALLGRGGMATVYQGFDQNLHRAVAIKVLSAALATDPAYVDRFRQEARLIASLRHPHIAQVYAFGEHA